MKNSIISFLSSRFAITTYILTVIGGGLIAVLNPQNLVTGFIPVVALVLNLFLAFIIPDLWQTSRKFKRGLRIVAIALVLLFLGVTFISIAIFDVTTFSASGKDHKSIRFVRGDSYSETGKEFEEEIKVKNGVKTVPPSLMLAEIGQDENNNIWEPTSFRKNSLTTTYTILLVMISFVSSISFFAEVQMRKEGTPPKKSGRNKKSSQEINSN